MTPSILMLYGPYAQHPWREDMFLRPDLLQEDFRRRGFGFDIAMVTQAPTGKDELPDVRIARDPVYDSHTGAVLDAHFLPGTIKDYPGVIDHWVHNFQDEVLRPNGLHQRTAHGIGLSPGQVWNHKRVQAFGNHKDKMSDLISKYGVGIGTYSVLDFEKFADIYGGSTPLIYKPQGGSLGLGIHVFSAVSELRSALDGKKLAVDGLIQPFLETKNPIQGLKPATPQDAKLLDTFNTKADRPREVRMHVITTTNANGKLQTEAYPMMKISYSARQTLKFQFGIGIDPSSLGPGTFMHDKSVALAEDLCRQADVPHVYGVFDWLVDGNVHDPDAVRVGDGNCRGPGLPVCASAAREAFVRLLTDDAKKIMNSK